MKLKRILSGAVACALAATVASSMAVTTSAAEGVAVAVASATVEAGKSFSVDVSLSSIPTTGVSALEFAIGYDKSVVTITGIKAAANADTGAAAEELKLNSNLGTTMVSGSTYSCLDYAVLTDQVSVSWVTGMESSDYWLKKTGTLFTIEGTIAAGATGKTDLTVAAIDRETYSGSGQKNAAMYAAAVDSSLKVTNYTVSGTKGTLTIGSDPVGGDKLLGDVRIDGVVDIKDLTKLAKAVAEVEVLTAQEKTNADVVVDDIIDIKDLVKLAKFIAEIIPNLG